MLTPDGFPLSYEVPPGNTNDRNTQMPFIKRLEQKYGKIGNLWLMDRGVPSEETLKAMREGGYRYLVGAPRGHLKILGKKLNEAQWEEVQKGIEVKTAQADGDTFVLTRSNARSLKETSMRDGRVVTLPRYVEPKDDVSLLLKQLCFTLPEQPPPKISEYLDAT